MKKPILNSIILIDRSGSMSNIWSQTISAVNKYIDQTKKFKDVTNRFTVIAFDRVNTVGWGVFKRESIFEDVAPVVPDVGADIQVIRDNLTSRKITHISKHEITPRGMTPLYDAIDRGIEVAEKAGYEKTTIIVITDGLENKSSKYTTKEQIRSRIKSAEARGWEITFIGAQFESEVMAADFGMSPDKFLDVGDAKDMTVAMAATAALSTNYASRGVAISYSAEIKKEMWKEKPLKFPDLVKGEIVND